MHLSSGAGRALANRALVLSAGFAILLSSRPLQAENPDREASTSRQARADAIRAVPFDRLAPQDRATASFVINNTSIYRRLPTQTIDCDAQMYQFLLAHPEIVVNMWHVLEVSKCTLQPVGPGVFRATDGAGTVCHIRELYRTPSLRVIHADTVYDGSLVRKALHASTILVLRSSYAHENGRPIVTSQLDAFIHIERGGIELLARALQSLIGRSADANFSETMQFVSLLSRTAEVNPDGTRRIAQRLTNVPPEVRERLASLSEAMAGRR